MKLIRTTLIAASLLAGFSGLSLAQHTMSMDSPRGADMQKMHEQRTQAHTKHLAELKSKLNLSTNQEAAWQSFEQSMQSPDHKLHPDRAAFEKMTTPERLDQMQAMKAQRDAAMQKHAEATKSFYAQLNAEQQKTFDAQSMSGMNGKGGMRAVGSGMQRMQQAPHHQH